MMETNIQTSLLLTNYLSGNHPLSGLRHSLSVVNLELIESFNPLYHLITLKYIQKLRSRTKAEDYLLCLTVEIPTDWHVGICHKRKSFGVIADMCKWNILRKVNEDRQCRLYYINPNIAHCMTAQQRMMYYENSYSLFNLTIPL